MNILCLSPDMIEYHMFEKLAQKDFNIHIGTRDTDYRPASIKNCFHIELPFFKSKFSWTLIKSLRRIIKEKKIDIIYCTTSTSLSNALFATLGTHVKCIGYRGTQAKVRKSDPTYYLAILNPRVNHIVCETTDIKDYLSHFLPESKLSLNTKPFEVGWIEEAMLHPQIVTEIPKNAFKVIYIANTKGRPYKGLATLVEAIRLVNNRKVHFTFIGNYDADIYNKTQESEIKNQVHFLGQRKDAIHFLPQQDVFILPSSRDASPRSVREAMACGLPCIVSDIPGSRDLIVDNETGLLVPPASPEAIARAITFIMENEKVRKRFGEASRQRIIHDFSLDNYVEKFEKLFREQAGTNIYSDTVPT